MILTWVNKEIGQIDFPLITAVFAEANGMDQILIGKICFEKCSVNAAKIDEIQATSCHDKERFGITCRAFGKILSKIRDVSDTVVHMELANTHQCIINPGFIRHTIRTVGNLAAEADGFLI